MLGAVVESAEIVCGDVNGPDSQSGSPRETNRRTLESWTPFLSGGSTFPDLGWKLKPSSSATVRVTGLRDALHDQAHSRTTISPGFRRVDAFADETTIRIAWLFFLPVFSFIRYTGNDVYRRKLVPLCFALPLSLAESPPPATICP